MKYNDNGTVKDIVIKAGDTLPVGTIVSYDGETIPSGWEQVTDVEEIINEKSTDTEKAYSCNYVNSIPSVKYVKTYKGQIGGEVSKDISLKEIEGNETILIFVSGIHYDGTDNYSHATYLLRKYGTYNALKQIDKKQAGVINLSLTYVPSENKITINNTGAYGCQYSITFI